MQLPLLGCPRLGKQPDTMWEETHSDLSPKATDIPGKKQRTSIRQMHQIVLGQSNHSKACQNRMSHVSVYRSEGGHLSDLNHHNPPSRRELKLQLPSGTQCSAPRLRGEPDTDASRQLSRA